MPSLGHVLGASALALAPRLSGASPTTIPPTKHICEFLPSELLLARFYKETGTTVKAFNPTPPTPERRVTFSFT